MAQEDRLNVILIWGQGIDVTKQVDKGSSWRVVETVRTHMKNNENVERRKVESRNLRAISQV